ncbi:stalk domain-containing protein [Peptoniphilus stercorisuis]|uniref:Exopolysaccharide biosynthesis protein n=1 Tax=Peptoniphilus stercorisuis TaxID=1436965 RepID=A0ABS4KBS2_9FIRM|nr:stalk domain-containing protein [Peptoniphilus stercorisuis]MBP2025226.1 exopolysaccharide biosynthesis protein [Peptoniphilus stercorisuis]
MNLKLRNICYSLILALSIVFTSVSTTFAESSPIFSEIIAPGLIRKEYKVDQGDKKTIINVLECDLDNPFLKIAVIPGKGKYNQRATVSQMASRVDSTAMVNGDFFNMLLQGTPEGPSIVDGNLQSSPCVMEGVYSLGIDESNTGHIEAIKFQGKVTAPNGKTYPIDGLNKSYYWHEPSTEYSHENKIQIYNDFWAASTRGDKKNTEILINSNGVIEQISENKSFPFPVPDSKMIMQVDGVAKDFILQNSKIGDKLNIDYSISPDRNWKFLIGGHALLVNNGQKVPYTKDINVLGGVRARTAAGLSKDGKKLYIASAEARTKRSAGMSLDNLSNFMKSIGCDIAVNLDGGGSTTMVVKNLGESNQSKIINPERNGAERAVVNGIGIFNTVKETGPAVGIKINGPDDMIIGQSADFTIKSAWDENYKPVDPNTMTYDLFDSNEDEAAWNITNFLARHTGEVDITLVTNNGVRSTKKVNVHDFDFVESLIVSSDKTKINSEDTVNFTVKAKLKNKKEVLLDPSVLKYQIDGFDGEFNNGVLKVNSLNDNASAKVTISAGDKSSSIRLNDINSKVIKMKINNKSYSINGENKNMDAAPFIKDNRTFVPIRFIVSALDGEVSWNNEARIATIKYDDKIIEIPINNKTIKVNGKEKAIDSPAVVKSNRTFVPIRFVAENLGMEIEYNNSLREVTIIDINKTKENIEEDNKEKPTNNENNKDVVSLVE